MKYRRWTLVWVLLAALVCVGVVALSLGSGTELPENPQQISSGSLMITEICTKNDSVIANNQGKYPDYIELYAPNQDVRLKGFTFTDGKKTSAPLGDMTLHAGEYRIFFLSDEDTGFALGASGGDTIQVLTGDGLIAAQASTTAMAADQVMLLVDGKYVVTDQASPGFSNDQAGLAAFREGFVQEAPQLKISELLVRNESVLPDENGIYSDVVELHNVSGNALDLGRFFLSDSPDDRFAYRLPDRQLPADGYLVLFCDGENYIAQDGTIHANFALSRGESLYLTDAFGGYQALCGDEAAQDTSWQLSETGAYTAGIPSLGYPNTQQGAELATQAQTDYNSALVISEVLLSSGEMPYRGEICDAVEIMNVSDQPVNTQGWYLSDGGDPYSYGLPDRLLQPGECLVVLCNRAGTGFGLSQGETVRLTGPDHRHAPLVTCAEAEPGQSISLVEGGQTPVYAFGPVSLGYANTSAGQESYLADQQPQGLRISEVMSNNDSYFRGPYGVTSDWLELYNGGSETVDLSQYALTDNPKYLDKYAMPQIQLEPGEYCVLYLTTDPAKARAGYGVVAMELSSKGDQVYLTCQGWVEDFVRLPELGSDEAYGRAEGSMAFSPLAVPTPEGKNSETAAVSDDPVAVTVAGSYEGVQYLDVELLANGTIFYTTDCNAPTQASNRYSGPIRITKTTVIRAISVEPGKRTSQVIDLTYLLNEGNDLPAVSLVTQPSGLWDYETGIYADGPGITDEFPYKGANYWQDWEIPATVTLFDKDGGFSQRCGLKIFGGFSRSSSKKSFACMFRGQYGASQLDYPLFGEEGLTHYEAFVLRSGGQDVYMAFGRDEIITSLAWEHLDIPVQRYKPVVVYLNGQYWGVYFIREKLNTQYVAGNYNVPPQEVAMAEGPGDYCGEYQKLREYILSHDLSSPESYETIAAQVDLENYTDYIITQLWLGNDDSANVKYFTAPGILWTWILYDTDLAFRDVYYNSFETQLDSGVVYGEWDRSCVLLAVKLLAANSQYRQYFLERLAYQVNNVWTPENVNQAIDTVTGSIDSAMARDGERWQWSYDMWSRHIENLRSFARRRSSVFVPQLQDYFHLTDQQMEDYGFQLQ